MALARTSASAASRPSEGSFLIATIRVSGATAGTSSLPVGAAWGALDADGGAACRSSGESAARSCKWTTIWWSRSNSSSELSRPHFFLKSRRMQVYSVIDQSFRKYDRQEMLHQRWIPSKCGSLS